MVIGLRLSVQEKPDLTKNLLTDNYFNYEH